MSNEKDKEWLNERTSSSVSQSEKQDILDMLFDLDKGRR